MKDQIKKEFYVRYDIGDVVYHIITGDKGIVVGHYVDRRDVMYKVSFTPDFQQYLYAVELTLDKPLTE